MSDAVILALSARFREYTQAVDDFSSAPHGLPDNDSVRRYLEAAESLNITRCHILRLAICCLPADGAAGACVQAQYLRHLVDNGEPEGRNPRRADYRMAVTCALSSIDAVLERLTAEEERAEAIAARDFPLSISPHMTDADVYKDATIALLGPSYERIRSN